ncbi:hypothetical protein [Nocardia yunnanensis]|uniref:hypothetical protein n=1 Tax=Nocardia yunnanensis TaxID=2382165 RepID=UPI001656EA25|nr:hypothetical protein [Nocardia yunnanensis]
MFRLESEVGVSYSQVYVESVVGGVNSRMDEAFAGQRSGLCGAAVAGELFLVTGLHSGRVGFTVEVHDQAPPLDAAWEDVVEVSFYPVSGQSFLVQWAGEKSWELDLREGIDYRVRYCAMGMDRAREQDVRLDGEPVVDRYLLQFWPAPPEPDRVVRQTSQAAARSHEYACRQPDFESEVRTVMAQRRALLTTGMVESRDAESPQPITGMVAIGHEADPDFVRGQLASLASYPPALHWDWVAAFETQHAREDRVGFLRAFLEEIGERAFDLGTVLAVLDSGSHYYLTFVIPSQFEQLSRLTGQKSGVESVRIGCWTPRMHPKQSEAIRAWARANAPRFSAARGRASTSPPISLEEEAEPDQHA